MTTKEYDALRKTVLNNTIYKMISGSKRTAIDVIGGEVFFTDKVIQSGGAQWGMYEWFNRGLRMASKQIQVDNTRENARAYDWDLVFINYTANASKMCMDYQNKIYSENGKNPDYPLLDDVTWDGGDDGLFHPNCYHYPNVYFPGFSDKLMEDNPIKDSETRKRSEATQEKRYNERNIREYTRRITLCQEAGIEVQESDIQKLREWKDKPHDINRVMGYYDYDDKTITEYVNKTLYGLESGV